MNLDDWRELDRAFARDGRRTRLLAPAPAQPVALEAATDQAQWRLVWPVMREALVESLPLFTHPARLNDTAAQLAADSDPFTTAKRAAVLLFERKLDAGEVAAMAERYARRGLSFADDALGDQLRAVIGVDPLRNAPELGALFHRASTEHARLIKTIPESFFDDVSRRAREAVRGGMLTRDLESYLRRTYYSGEGKDRAKRLSRRLARDQVGKLVGAANHARQVSLGIRRYTWRTARDERVRGNPSGLYPRARPSHYAREGVVFEWSKPPEGGHPGHAIQCRCYPEPMIDDIEALRSTADRLDEHEARRAAATATQLDVFALLAQRGR